MNQSEIRQFLQRFAEGNHSEPEHERFIHWLHTSADEEVEAAARAYEAILEKQAGARKGDAGLAVKVERWLDEVDERVGMTERPRPSRLFRLMPAAAAAVLLLIATAGIYYYFTRPGTTSLPAPATQQAGLIKRTVGPRDTAVIRLEDGSRIVLNGGSTLAYHASYRGKAQREVHLSGEAYFEVLHNEQQPFIIHTRDMDIVDLGTIFNVKAYPGEAMTETTLLEGAIEVRLKHENGRKVLLKPLEKVTYYNPDTLLAGATPAMPAGNMEIAIKPVTPVTAEHMIEETAWMNDLLAFHDRSFAELATSMERRFNVTIRFADAPVKAYRYTGIFRDESLDQALHELQLSRPFHYSAQKDTIIIHQ
ncbi:FecR family protein [Chitinophaga cymbidii]|uniref:Anti-sigma factor n=1 Tax=Chitinophaga cymbidii TaxID=1096750 RepID=A0A512RP85_9BACT|nr:FecR domain-containing protein [Chitinophaga cymbidii]GEP97513.1 anti-sigma factor [Chitinophaga cymbidii]